MNQSNEIIGILEAQIKSYTVKLAEISEMRRLGAVVDSATISNLISSRSAVEIALGNVKVVLEVSA